jgi:hypothetical protein
VPRICLSAFLESLTTDAVVVRYPSRREARPGGEQDEWDMLDRYGLVLQALGLALGAVQYLVDAS